MHSAKDTEEDNVGRKKGRTKKRTKMNSRQEQSWMLRPVAVGLSQRKSSSQAALLQQYGCNLSGNTKEPFAYLQVQ